MKKAVVTGVAGFVGSTLADRLVREGVEVVGIDSLTDYYEPSLKESNLSEVRDAPGFSFVGKSLLDDIDDELRDADTVFHQAGQPGVRPSWGSTFEAYTRDNVLATQRLLEAVMRAAPGARVVYASSSSIYGDAERYPTRETDRPGPISPYGVTKLAAEHLVSLYAKNFGLDAVSLRYFTVYGPRQRPDMAFTRFISRALDGRPVELYGDGTQVRDFTFVDDVVEANLLAATATGVPGGEVFNVSGGASVSVNEVLDALRDILGTRIEVVHRDKATGDVLRTGGDSTKAAELLAWSPRVGLASGLEAQADWLEPRADTLRALTR